MTVEEILQGDRFPSEKEWDLDYQGLKKLFWKYKGLQKDLSRKEAFWAATNENLTRAYGRLDEKDRELARAYGLNQRYLDNIREGLLLVDRDKRILGQYSSYLTDLFNTTEIEGRDLVDFLFPDDRSQAAEREELAQFLSILFNNTQTSMDMIMEINPLVGKKIYVPGPEGGRVEKVIDATFIRITEEEQVVQLMVIFHDRTIEANMERRLADERSRHESELETLSAILKAGPETFAEFIEEAAGTLELLETDQRRLADRETCTSVLKQVHSLKGSARYFALNRVSEVAHQIEDTLSAFLSEAGQDAQDRLREKTALLVEAVQDIRSINESFAAFSRQAAGPEAGRGAALTVFLQTLEQMSLSIGEELGKKLAVTIDNSCTDLPHLGRLRKPIVHILRNAIDHGIEDPYQRLANGKEETGNVTINVREEAGGYSIDVIDDGAGVDFARIRQRAVGRKLLSSDKAATDRDLLNLIFSPSFSIKEEASGISGRGFGLDIVRDVVRELNGRIYVATKANKGTRFTLWIPRG